MPVRSWLAKAKSIHDIGGEFYTGSAGKEWDDKRDEQAERRRRRALERPIPVESDDRPYFGSLMHDSRVLGIERINSELRLRLASINAKDFAFYMARALDLPRVDAIWPVDLVLHGVSYVRAARADLRGGLRFVGLYDIGEAEFLYDWAFQQEEAVQWIAQLWRRPDHRKLGDLTVYLMVDCARMSAEDRCAEVFAKAYGEPAARLYLDAVQGLDDEPIDFNVYDSQGETPDYIGPRMAYHGFRREDFVS